MTTLLRGTTLTLGLMLLSACGTTAVHPQHETTVLDLHRPRQILVYDLATSEADISPKSSATSHARARMEKKTNAQRSEKIAREAAGAFSDDLVEQLRDLGFDALRARRGTPVIGKSASGLARDFLAALRVGLLFH